MNRLAGNHLTMTYGAEPIIVDTSLSIESGLITSIIGPNGCGKSTLLKGLARLHPLAEGSVVLDGQLIHRLPSREVAKRLGLLPQQATVPDGLTVEDLVIRGRFPHRARFGSQSSGDLRAVERALALSGMSDVRSVPVDELSGGQRQRAWIAMALAQETPILLLDEPTTFLDVAHQLDVMNLIERLNQDLGTTIVMVLHDLNEAARVSDRIVAMHDGRVDAYGLPADVITPERIRRLYGVECAVNAHPVTGHVYILPAFERLPKINALDSSDAPNAVSVDDLGASYGSRLILDRVSARIPAGSVTTIIGPNACGKSTLLRCCACLLRPVCGCSRLGDVDVRAMKRKDLARRLAYMAQGLTPPSGFLVEDLVAFGRMPHQGFLRQWREDDERAVEEALAQCRLCELRYREIDTLSGGQRQRAWFAMAMAQDTPVLMLDEPTTFLDLGAQIELLEMAVQLNRARNRTVALVLHDMNLAARYSDWIIAMKGGNVVAAGPPENVITKEVLAEVFEVDCTIVRDPISDVPYVLVDRKVDRAALTQQLPVQM